MGFFKSTRKLMKITRENTRDWDPAADTRQGLANMKAASATMGSTLDIARLRTGQGVKAKGKILAMNDTGMALGGAAVTEYKVLVTRDDAAPYEVSITRQAMPGEAGVFTVGMDLNIYVDKDDAQRIAW